MPRYYSSKMPKPHETFYDHFPVNEDWRKYTAPTADDWLRFRQEIAEYGCAQQASVLYAVAYLVAHLGGKFPPKAQQGSSFWGRVAQAAFDWYYYAIGSVGELTPDPAVHFRALRFVVVGFAGLGKGPA